MMAHSLSWVSIHGAKVHSGGMRCRGMLIQGKKVEREIVTMLLASPAHVLPGMQQTGNVLETDAKFETGTMFCKVNFFVSLHTVVFCSNTSYPTVERVIRSGRSGQWKFSQSALCDPGDQDPCTPEEVQFCPKDIVRDSCVSLIEQTPEAQILQDPIFSSKPDDSETRLTCAHKHSRTWFQTFIVAKQQLYPMGMKHSWLVRAVPLVKHLGSPVKHAMYK